MSFRSFAGKRILITVAASGIGRALAEVAARHNAVLILTDIDAHRLNVAASELRQSGADILATHPFDVSDHDAVQAFATRFHDDHGSVDILVNNAGIAVWGEIDKMPHDEWRRVIDINLMGPIHMMEAFVPPMIRAGRGGHIVNVSSAAGLFGLPWHGAYSASKFGLRGLSEVLRFDLRRHGIQVTLVCPGAVDTGLVHTLDVRGVDTASPSFQAMRARFQRHAVSPDVAAERILEGVRRGRYLVYTSPDIRIGHWVERTFSLPYVLAMRALNDRVQAIADESRRAP
ncbi:MAG: SDR family oxidoreductase [Anaerolineae bacterium]|nr:SDR family oxidoreductase [Anaerolineae bacterium]